MPYEFIDDIPQTQLNAARSPSQELVRGGLRTAARGVESVLGLPGDIANTVLGLSNFGIEKLTGSQSPLPKSFPIPGSQDIRKATKYTTGEYLEPEGEGEKFWDDIVGDFATLAIPIKGKIPFKNAAIKALGGNLASWGAKELGAGELGQAGAKLGFTTIANLSGGRKALEKKMNESYDLAKKLVKGKTIGAEKLINETEKIFEVVNKGDKPYKDFINERLTNLNKSIYGDKIDVADAWELKRDMNSFIRDPKTPKGAIPVLKKITGDLNSSLQTYAKKSPKFRQVFNEAEDIYRGLNQASTINRFLQEHTTLESLINKYKSVKGLFAYTFGAPKTLATAALARGASEGVKSFEFLKNSKEAQKYYANALKAAAENNVGLFSRNLKGLNMIASKSETTEPKKEIGRYEFID